MSKSDLTDAPPAYASHHHAGLTLNMSDRLRLIRFPSTIIDVVRQAIVAGWPKGLNKERQDTGFYEFKLHGNPWWGHGEESALSRSLMSHILSALHNHGWYLLTSTDISKKQLDKDTLIFQIGVPPPQTAFFAVSFNDHDKLRLIGVPPELIPSIQQTVGQANIQKEEWRDGGMTYQFKLRGSPWVSYKEESITSRLLLLSLLDCFTTFGWKLHASIDISQGYEGRDIDSWFFRRDNP